MGDSLFSWWLDSFEQLNFNVKENLAFLKPITDALLTTGRLNDAIAPLCIETDQRWARRSVVRYGVEYYENLMIEEKDRDERFKRKRVNSGDGGDDGGATDGSGSQTTVTPSPKRLAIGGGDKTNKGSHPKPKGLGMTGLRGLQLNNRN